MKVSYQKELVTSARTTANAPGFKTQFKIVGITLSMPTHKIQDTRVYSLIYLSHLNFTLLLMNY